MKNKRFAVCMTLSLILLLWGGPISGEEFMENVQVLYYRSQPRPLTYNLTIRSKSRPEALFEPGPLQETDDVLKISQSVVKVSEGLFDIALTVDGINWEEHGPTMGSEYKREQIIGNTGHIKVNLLGKVEEAKGIPHISSRYFHRGSLDGPPLDIYRAMLMLYPRFPLKLLKKGDSWRSRDKIMIESAEALPIRGIATLKYELDMRVERDIKYTLIDYAERKGHRAAHIGFDATFNTEGSIITESREDHAEGDGKCSGDFYFSTEEGLLLEIRMESEVSEMKSVGGRVRHWFNPERSIFILLGGNRSTPITWRTDQKLHLELVEGNQ